MMRGLGSNGDDVTTDDGVSKFKPTASLPLIRALQPLMPATHPEEKPHIEASSPRGHYSRLARQIKLLSILLILTFIVVSLFSQTPSLDTFHFDDVNVNSVIVEFASDKLVTHENISGNISTMSNDTQPRPPLSWSKSDHTYPHFSTCRVLNSVPWPRDPKAPWTQEMRVALRNHTWEVITPVSATTTDNGHTFPHIVAARRAGGSTCLADVLSALDEGIRDVVAATPTGFTYFDKAPTTAMPSVCRREFIDQLCTRMAVEVLQVLMDFTEGDTVDTVGGQAVDEFALQTLWDDKILCRLGFWGCQRSPDVTTWTVHSGFKTAALSGTETCREKENCSSSTPQTMPFVPQKTPPPCVSRDDLTPDSINIGFIVLISNSSVKGSVSLQIAERLLKHISSHPRHQIVIHTDASPVSAPCDACPLLKDEVARLIDRINSPYKNIHLTSLDISARWGASSLVLATLIGLSDLYASGFCFDFLINLSESDFPCVSNERLHATLARHAGKSFLDIHDFVSLSDASEEEGITADNRDGHVAESLEKSLPLPLAFKTSRTRKRQFGMRVAGQQRLDRYFISDCADWPFSVPATTTLATHTESRLRRLIDTLTPDPAPPLVQETSKHGSKDDQQSLHEQGNDTRSRRGHGRSLGFTVGSQWFVLSRDAVAFIMHDDLPRALFPIVRATFAPDETFFNSALTMASLRRQSSSDSGQRGNSRGAMRGGGRGRGGPTSGGTTHARVSSSTQSAPSASATASRFVATKRLQVVADNNWRYINTTALRIVDDIHFSAVVASGKLFARKFITVGTIDRYLQYAEKAMSTVSSSSSSSSSVSSS